MFYREIIQKNGCFEARFLLYNQENQQLSLQKPLE
jgi:hypothetical protein